MDDIFNLRCQNEPQVVIKDLIEQTSRQAAEIYRVNLLIEAVLTPLEATHLLKIMAARPVEISRDFYMEDVEEKLIKKLKIIQDSEIKKAKKAKKVKVEKEAMLPL